jgi:poly(3-hydroxybutyrate) depolymerase
MGSFLDAALNGAEKYAGKAYFFKGPKYYRYDWDKDKGDADPLGLDEWGFPSPFIDGIDAAIEGREGYAKKAFFFKDDQYLQYDWVADKVDSGYPKSIDDWGIPAAFFGGKKKIDAAVNGVGPDARYCYLFCGTSWVKIDWQDKEPAVLHKGLAEWKIPDAMAQGIDAALSGWGDKYGSKTYFFSVKKYARYDWGADACDLKNGDLAAWKMSLTDAPAQVTGGDPPDIVPQTWNKRTGKVWVPDGASGKLPLVVYLHGNSGLANLWGAGRMLADDATFKSDTDAMNLGNLAGKLIADNKIKPLIVAAPSDTLKDLPGDKLWQSLDFGAFVNAVDEKVKRQYGVGIDFARVAVVGWSGGGGWPNNGVAKVAKEGAMVKGNPLKLIGLADGEVRGAYSKPISDALLAAKNNTTVIYSVHKVNGGNRYTSEADYAAGFGLKRKLKDKDSKQKDEKKGLQLPTAVEDADRDAFELYMDDGDANDPPTRTVAKVADTEVQRHWQYFLDAKATTDKPPRSNNHTRMPLVWSWYALQRYFK